MIKRTLDVIGSLVGLTLFAPLLILIGLYIRLDSSGPIFFRQQRVGRYGTPFAMFKFRTMVAHSDGIQLTADGDERITRAGAVLRHYKLDELPQLLNVLKGEMSLVGPRPEVPEYVKHYPDDIRELVLSIRPGMTDLASVEYRHEGQLLANTENPVQFYINDILPHKLEYCRHYVTNQSIWLDAKIMVRTLIAIIR